MTCHSIDVTAHYLSNLYKGCGMTYTNIAEEDLEVARHYLEDAFKFLERGDPYDACEKLLG
jgi:hypothetical protein